MTDPRYLIAFDAEVAIAANSVEEADQRLPELVAQLEQLPGVTINIFDQAEVLDLDSED